jgi:beta-glucanase (GH16 family)
MKFLFALFFLVSLALSAAKDDEIIITAMVNLPIYSQAQDSYCKQRDIKENVIWEESFTNSALSKDDWSYATGNGFNHKGQYIPGWGNGELQYYRKGTGETFTNANLFIQEGLLKIQPIFHKKGFRGFQYTSARILSKTKKIFTYPSKLTICFKVPKGVGFWPAFWLMPEQEVGWPQGGEIDILENRGRIANVASSALHYGKTATNKSTLVGEAMIPKTVNFQESFHSITFEWLKDELNFYLDNDTEPYFTVNSKLEAFNKFGYPFNSSYYLIINTAVGGIYDGYNVDSNAFCIDEECSNKEIPDNARFLIDWIEYSKL